MRVSVYVHQITQRHIDALAAAYQDNVSAFPIASIIHRDFFLNPLNDKHNAKQPPSHGVHLSIHAVRSPRRLRRCGVAGKLSASWLRVSFEVQVFGVERATNLNDDDVALFLLRHAFRLSLQVERIGNASCSRQTRHSFSGKNAFSFRSATGEGHVFGSRENEASLLHIAFESTNNGPLPLNAVASVRIINRLNGARSDLEIAVSKTSPIHWSLSAFLDPIELRRMANAASARNEGFKNREFSFDMIVAVVPAGSNRVVDLCYTLYWRTVGRMTPMFCQFGRRIVSNTQARLPQPLRSAVPRILRPKKGGYGKAIELECRAIRYAA